MTLSFPNESRHFDRQQNAICFVGHDGMFEVRFFVDVGALASPGASVDQYLGAFETARAEIYRAASKAYARSRESGYRLTASDIK